MTNTDSIKELTALVRDFGGRRDWDQFHDPKNLVMGLASEVGELAAVLRWIQNSESDSAVRGELRDRVEAEIGDVGILLLALCGRADVNLGTAITRKLATNEAQYPVGPTYGKHDRPAVG